MFGILAAFAIPSPAAPADRNARMAEFFTISEAPMPVGVDPQIGGLDTTSDGKIVAVFHHGQVGILDPGTGTWSIFAEGLHEPLGVLAEKDGSFLVMQRSELTRLRDADADGVADHYETVWDDFGMTGNYHEFAFGPARGPNGKLYAALNVASNGDSIRPEIRGEWLPIGVPREKFYTHWKQIATEAGRMYSRVPWRGWVMEIDPATGKGTPVASGFRSPDGIGFDAAGRLLVDDNQGDWRGTNELFVVKPGGFYGHPASLPWRADWKLGDPLRLSIEQLDELRTPPAIYFPYGRYSNSPTQIVTIPNSPAWGPFGGQTLVGEMNNARLLRVMLEEVGGLWQGACATFVEAPALKPGLHRMTFTGDTLWIGRTHLSWAGHEGMVRVTPTGRIPFAVVDMKLTERGFRFEFTEPLNPATLENLPQWTAQRFSYRYHAAYGSPEEDRTAVIPSEAILTNDGRTVELVIPELRSGVVYDFNLPRIEARGGAKLLDSRIAYTVNRLKKR
jgi:hypothetical protein